MIPRAVQQLDIASLREPGRETVEYPYWLGTQRDYDDGFYDEATWELAADALRDERATLDTVAAEARDEDEFEELAYEHSDEEAALSGYLELGVTGLCIALNAAGGVTASSCRGHSDSPCDLPQVILACDKSRGEVLLDLARQAGCGIENFGTTGLVLYAASVGELLRLGELVLESRERFEALPPGPERDEPSEDSWD
jgi:hypothetical protein